MQGLNIIDLKLDYYRLVSMFSNIQILLSLPPEVENLQLSSYMSILNTIKTTFDYYQAIQTAWINGNKEKMLINSFSLFTCKFVIRKKLVSNQNLNRKVHFIVLI